MKKYVKVAIIYLVAVVVGVGVLGVVYFLAGGGGTETEYTKITNVTITATRDDDNNLHFYANATIYNAETSIGYITHLGITFVTKKVGTSLTPKVGEYAELPPQSEVSVEFEGSLYSSYVEDWDLSPGTYVVELTPSVQTAPTPLSQGFTIEAYETTVVIP